MPGVNVTEKLDIDSGGNLVEESLLASSKINTFKGEDVSRGNNFKNLPPITPRTDFAIRQANHLVERICRDHGVEAPKFSFSKCLNGQEEQIANWSSSKHTSVLRLAEYLHKRGQIERDYALSIQKLNRHVVQTGDTDERLGQLIVMGEKTAAGHMDWARKIGEERIIEELKSLCGGNDEQRKYLMSELKKLRATWSKAVGAFEKVRKNRDKAIKAADAAQLALDTAVSRGNSSKFTMSRLQEDVYLKSDRARIARDEYNRAMNALTLRQNEIFKDQIPQCLEGFEKMERARIAAVRASMISLAQVHLAVADVEIESGQRWLKSLVSLSVDDEIEMFIRSVEERSNGHKIIEEDIEVEEEEQEEKKITIQNNHISAKDTLRQDSPDSSISRNGLYSCYTNLTNSESDLLKVPTGIEDISDPLTLTERKEKLETLQTKLKQQFSALERMEQAYMQDEDSGNEATLEAVRMSMRGIRKEIDDNGAMVELIEEKLSKIPEARRRSIILERADPMSSIMEELNRLDQRRSDNFNLKAQFQAVNDQQKPRAQVQKKKALSRSFEDILRESDSEMIVEECASPKATGLKLPGAQWTAESINKSNEEIGKLSGDYFCAEEEDVGREEELVAERRMFRNQRESVESTGSQGHSRRVSFSSGTKMEGQSPRRKSVGQATPAASAIIINQQQKQQVSNLIPQNNRELFKVQALYNFIGRKETDELDLRTGEILGVYEASGEWWEAENDAGIRGYIPFNYVIRL